MVSRKTFSTNARSKVAPTNTTNHAGGRAYSLSNEQILAQYAVTSCFNNTFYVSAEEQLSTIKKVVDNCSPELIAKAAVYGHEKANMKDMPAYLLAVLAARGELDLLKRAFPRVVTNAKMLCNFVQIMRSGELGRKSFGTAVKKLIQGWFQSQYCDRLFAANIGQANPSLADIIKMTHPKAENQWKNELYKYLLGKEYNFQLLPENAKAFESVKQGEKANLAAIPFRALTNCELTLQQWREIAENMPWNTLRMNLNMLQRKGVFEDKQLTKKLAKKLSDPKVCAGVSGCNYQLLTAYQNTDSVPTEIRNALQDALEISTENIPDYGDVIVCVDTSGSMSSPVTGYRVGSTTKTRCVDVAALIASCILRKNQNAEIIPFDTTVHRCDLNPRDSIMTNAQKLARYGGGGTSCSVALADANRRKLKADLVVYVSDNESWCDYSGYRYGTGVAQEWAEFKRRNPKAKMVLIDLTPNTSAQAKESKDVLLVGGFSDAVFDVINNFVRSTDNFVDTVKAVEL